MSIQNLEVRAGKLFCLSSGEYSDYGYSGHFLALQDITPETFAEIVSACKESAKLAEESGDWANSEAGDRFIPELIRRGLVVDVDVQEIHIGSYGELDLS